MPGVFISYRRDDSQGQARALFRDLCDVLGKSAVFMDVDSIALGRDYREVLQEYLASSDLMLVLIGPRWLTAEDSAGRRLDHSDDYVRQEVATALKRKIPVTPVLVQGARIPDRSQLPDDLKDLAYRNGFELSHARWDSDVRELIQRLSLRPTHTRPPRSRLARWAAAVGAVLIIAALLWLNTSQWFRRPSTSAGNPSPMASSSSTPSQVTPPSSAVQAPTSSPVQAPASSPVPAATSPVPSPTCSALYGTYDMTLTRTAGAPSCLSSLGSRWTLSGDADCSHFRVREAGNNITFRGTISPDGRFKATGSDVTIEGTATASEIIGTDTNPLCTFAVSGQR